MFGIGVGAMAMVVVLSAFNGIEKLVEGLYTSFDPDIRIEATTGKTFNWEDFPANRIRSVESVEFVSKSLEETVLMKYRDAQYFVTIKGVDEEYLKLTKLDSNLFDGQLKLKEGNNNFCILGYGVADQLNVFLSHIFEPIKVYAAKRNAKPTNMQESFMVELIYPSGIFAVNPEFDFKYAIAPYSFTETILQQIGKVTSVEIGIRTGETDTEVQKQLQIILGEKYVVKTKYELNEVLYQTNQTEKWVTFLILSFILLIAAFNLIGSLTVLIIDKKQDLFVLQAMGANKRLIKKIFLAEGMLISAIGGSMGMLLGLILGLLQKHVGLLKLQEGTIAEYYPIELEFLDFCAVGGIVIFIGFLAAFFPARFVVNKYLIKV